MFVLLNSKFYLNNDKRKITFIPSRCSSFNLLMVTYLKLNTILKVKSSIIRKYCTIL